jgi:hypothetical protein
MVPDSPEYILFIDVQPSEDIREAFVRVFMVYAFFRYISRDKNIVAPELLSFKATQQFAPQYFGVESIADIEMQV